MPDSFRIQAIPALRTVTPGAKITYKLEPLSNAPSVKEIEVRWFAINDAQAVTLFRPQSIPGPVGMEWKDAIWTVAGHHRIVCHVRHKGSTSVFTYEQWVAPIASELQGGPRLPQDKADPDAVLDTVTRFVGVLRAANAKFPAKSKADIENFEKILAQQESYRDKLAERLKDTANFKKHAFQAEHFDAETQRREPLRIFICKVAFDKWTIVDWTNPMVRAATGEYSAEGQTAQEAVQNAVEDWDSDNRYPNGGISFKIPAIPDLNLAAISKNFETDGSAYWDSVSSFFGWIGLGAAVVAGVVTLVAPVPGSQVVSAAIWTSIFSSSAAAVINIGTRIDEGFSSWQANAFDVLTIVGNVFGAGGILWSRGANTIINLNNKAAKFALIGAITTDGVQGIMLGIEHAKEFDAIQGDPNLSPQERTNRLVKLFGSALANGLLLYVSVKGSKTDLDNLNLKGSVPGGTTPAERLKQLGDPKETVDLTKPPKAEGKSTDKTHTTRVNVDQEMQAPQTAGASKKIPEKPKPKIAGPQKTSDLDALYAEAAVAKQELDTLTRSLAGELGGEAQIPPTLKGKERAKEKIATDYSGDASQIVDLARSTIVFKNMGQLEKAFERLKATGKITRTKDRFQNPLNGYRDVLLNVKMSNGHIVEMQLHLESIINVKNGPGHPLYEKERAIQAKATAEKRNLTLEETAEIKNLQEKMKVLYDQAFFSEKGNK